MAEQSAISWTDATFNPWIGCTKVSPACTNCYAERDFDRRKHIAKWGPNGTRIMTSPANWKKPIKWNELAGNGICLACHPCEKKDGTRRPCSVCNSTGKLERRPRIFCASLADVFEDWGGAVQSWSGHPIMRESRLVGPAGKTAWESQPLKLADVRRDLFELIEATPNLDWLLLTKRPENIRRMWVPVSENYMPAYVSGGEIVGPDCVTELHRPNVWLGTSTENQEQADKRIPELLKCRDLAPVLFLSCEPLLGPIELSVPWEGEQESPTLQADWVIAGGESGPNARPSHPDWFRSVRDQCDDADVPFHFKQHGEWVGHPDYDPKTMPAIGEMSHGLPMHCWEEDLEHEAEAYRVGVKRAGRLLDGVLHDAFPAVKLEA